MAFSACVHIIRACELLRMFVTLDDILIIPVGNDYTCFSSSCKMFAAVILDIDQDSYILN